MVKRVLQFILIALIGLLVISPAVYADGVDDASYVADIVVVNTGETATFYPDPDVEVSSVDGKTEEATDTTTWATMVGAAGDSAVDNGASGNFLAIASTVNANEWDYIDRSAFLLNTGPTLPDTATIQSATLSVYGTAKTDTFAPAIAPNINVYASTPASNVALVAGDYAQVAAVPFCNTPITYAGWDIAGYNNFTLNAAGLAAISKTGVTKFSLRNANYDVAVVTPTWSASHAATLQGYFADQAGTANDPKLVVTYAVTALTNVTTVCPINTQALIDGKYVTSDLLNTAFQTQGGSDVPYMPGVGTNPWVFWIDSIGANESKPYLLYTGGPDMQTGFSYFPAAGGMTTNDNDVSLELGDNFVIEQRGWVDTTASANKDLILKTGAFRTYISADGNISSYPGDGSTGSINPFSSASDGHITVSGSVYDTVRDAASGTVNAGGTTFSIGQNYDTTPTDLTLRPNADGDVIQLYNTGSNLVNTWQMVDEEVADDATTYVYDYNGYSPKYSLYNLPNHTTESGTINSVKVYVRVNEFTPFTGTFRIKIKTEGTEYDNGSNLDLPSAWTTYNNTWATNPHGGAWTWTQIDALQAGILMTTSSATGAVCTQVYVKVNYTYPVYNTWRSFVFPSTLSIPDTVKITGATLSLYGQADNSTTDFNITITNGQPTYPTDPLATTDYNRVYYSGNGGSLNTSSFTVEGYNNITLNSTGLGWISKTGTTKLCFMSSRDIGGNTPTGNEYVTIYTSEEAGTSKDPKLTVYYEYPVVTATGISSGVLKVKTTADGTNLLIQVYDENDVLLDDDTAALGGASVPPNGSNWSFITNGSMPYMDYQKIWVNGTLVQHIVYERDTVFDDLTTYNNDATPTFVTTSSDPDVSATLLNFRPVSEAKCAVGATEEEPEILPTAPEEPEAFFGGAESGIENLPGAAAINDLLDSANIPQDFFWILAIYSLALGAVLLSYHFIRSSLLWPAIVGGAVIAFFSAVCLGNPIPFWTVFIYGIRVTGWLVSERTYGW